MMNGEAMVRTDGSITEWGECVPVTGGGDLKFQVKTSIAKEKCINVDR